MFRGSIVALVTPMKVDGAIDHAALERLLEFPIRTLYPSHGPVHMDGARLIRKFLRHREEREQKILGALTGNPLNLEQLLPQAYGDVAEDIYPVAARSLLAGLIKLEEDGKCERAGSGWRLLSGGQD